MKSAAMLSLQNEERNTGRKNSEKLRLGQVPNGRESRMHELSRLLLKRKGRCFLVIRTPTGEIFGKAV